MKSVPVRLIRKALPVIGILLLVAGCAPAAVPVACDAPAIVVTKTADTNDGVCSAADCSLREAVLRSNACPGVQTIRIPAGTYNLTRAGAGEDAASTGDLDILDGAHIEGTGNPVIDGQRQDRIFQVMSGASVVMSGLVIQHGQALSGGGILNDGTLVVQDSRVIDNSAVHPAGTSDFGNGGGILSEGDGSLQVVTSEISGNSADQGGGVMVLASGVTSPTVQLSYTTLQRNTVTFAGGALWLDNAVQATLVRYEISDNHAADRGSGIYNAARLELTHGSIANNTGGIYGGGIYNEPAGDITATELLLQGNVTRYGGGIYNKGPARFYLTAILDNQAERGQGGGIYNFGSDSALTLENTTISGNLAPLGGGGIRNEDGNYRMMFVTLALNEPEGVNGSGGGEMQTRNSIFADNVGGNCAGTPPGSLGYNIDSANTCAFVEGSDFTGTAPLLEPIAMNGGMTPTHALGAASPAVDSADPDRCDGSDQRGTVRPQGPNCDRGAYEKEPAAAGGTGSIEGIVWNDLCALPDGPMPPAPPMGCISMEGAYVANGVFEPPVETGMGNVHVRLGSGACPAYGASLAVTNAGGHYSFTGLAAGIYCVSIDAISADNIPELVPGGWSYPVREGNVAQTEITLSDGEARSDINFGWNFQYGVGWPESTPTPTPTPTPIALSFAKPILSTNRLFYYYGGQCTPGEMKFQIQASDPNRVASVGLFLRLEDKATGEKTSWSQGYSMNPLGKGFFTLTIKALDVPAYNSYAEAWLQYQFLANDKAGNKLLYSEVFRDLTLSRCGKPTVK